MASAARSQRLRPAPTAPVAAPPTFALSYRSDVASQPMLPHTPRRLPAATSPTRPPARGRAPAAFALLLVAAAAGCGNDPLEAASINNIDTIAAVFVAYPFSSAPTPLPTALSLSGIATVRPAVVTVAFGSGSLLIPNFDFAVDRLSDGRVRLLPSKLIAGLDNTGRVLRTGLQVVTTPFDSLGSAPQGTYQRDSATVVSAGQTIAVETEPAACLGSSRTFIYAKLVVDSVSAATGGVYIRARIDPNCGYRSLQPGRPTR